MLSLKVLIFFTALVFGILGQRALKSGPDGWPNLPPQQHFGQDGSVCFVTPPPIFYRPCPGNNIFCIQRFVNCDIPSIYKQYFHFYYNGMNKPMDTMEVYLPTFNLTITQHKPMVSGIDRATIIDYSVTKHKDQYLKLNFTDMWINATSQFRYHTTGVEFYAQTREHYETIIIQSRHVSSALDIDDDTVVNTEIPKPPTHFDLGACFTGQTNPALKALFQEMKANQKTVLLEMFYERSRHIAERYLETYVCRG